MAFYFFVVGLETRREFDIGELRERRRVVLPVTAGIAGMLASSLIFVAITSGSGAAHGWGVALSTDTAFALGVLALVGPRLSNRLRAFLLTVVITDDVIALVAIATVYTESVVLGPLLVAVLLLVVVIVLIRLRVRSGLVYLALGVAAWVALLGSGVDPVVIGLVLGLLTFARPVATREPRAGHRTCSAASGSSRRPGWRAVRARASRRRSRRTSGSRSCSTPGPAT